jgi:hypothetical protein
MWLIGYLGTGCVRMINLLFEDYSYLLLILFTDFPQLDISHDVEYEDGGVLEGKGRGVL